MEKNEFLSDILAGLFIAILAFIFALSYIWFAFNYFSTDDNKPNYEVEIWHDDDTNLTMRIFKDKTGDVLYCEPVEVEMGENK